MGEVIPFRRRPVPDHPSVREIGPEPTTILVDIFPDDDPALVRQLIRAIDAITESRRAQGDD